MTFEEFLEEGWASLRRCSICGAPIGVQPHPTQAIILFNSNCECTAGRSAPEIADWDQVREALAFEAAG